jgi:hypothetical protein
MATVYFTEEGYMYSKIEDEETCEHGMSAWLCMGPMHYPSRQDEMEGRYW